jgi:hypothetical protein
MLLWTAAPLRCVRGVATVAGLNRCGGACGWMNG